MLIENSQIPLQTTTLSSMEPKKTGKIAHLETKDPGDFTETNSDGHPARYDCYSAKKVPVISL